MNSFKQVSEMLARSAADVARYLLPQGKRSGDEWCVGNILGEPGESLKVKIAGEKAGIWCDFASGEHKGDLLDLWAATRGIDTREALKEAQHYLGINPPKFEAYKPKKYTRPQLKSVTLVQTSPVMDYLQRKRNITFETIQAFKVGEQGREIIFNYFRDDELIFVKYLHLDRLPNGKKQMHTETGAEPCLYGWQALSPTVRKVALTEGEIDAMTLHQYGIPALSVPFGGGAGDKQKWIENEFDRLTAFDEIYLCFDPDDEGKSAVVELIGRLGRHRCRVVEFPYKDPNECLQKGVTKDEIQKCFDEARTLDPDELKQASYFVDQVVNEFFPKEGTILGYNPPWQYALGKILFRPDELSIWSGINGHGKSQMIGNAILSMMKQGARVCIASLEIKPKKLLSRLTRQAMGIVDPTEGYIRAVCEWYSDKLWLFDLVGTAKSDRLLEVFLYARQRYGIDVFIIDSFMKCGIDEEDFKAQKAFIEKICDFKNQYSCQVHIVAHPRKLSDESQPPSKLDVKGSGAITDLADSNFVVWRNKKKEELLRKKENGILLTVDEEKKLEELDALWICDKQRENGWEGKIMLWFDKKSLQYLGHPKNKPIQFVDYSRTRGVSNESICTNQETITR